MISQLKTCTLCMSTVIGYALKYVLCLSLRLYRPCARLSSPFTLIYYDVLECFWLRRDWTTADFSPL